MKFTKLNDDLACVGALPDRPEAADGYTPDALKAVFDRAGLSIQTYLNQVLTRELEDYGKGASAAEKLGSAPIAGLRSHTVHAQLTELKEGLDTLEKSWQEELGQLVNGVLPAGSVGEDRLTDGVRDQLHGWESLSLRQTVLDTPGEHRFTAPRTGCYRFRLVGAGAAGTLVHPDAYGVGTYYGHGGGAGAWAEFTVAMQAGEVASVTVGKGGVAANAHPGDTMTTTDYHTGYVANEAYSFPGGLTQVELGGGRWALAAGGDVTRERVVCITQGLPGVLCGSGAPHAYNGATVLSVGADSAMGLGGAETLSAGYGAGGAGGSISFDGDDYYTVLLAPAPGGNGAVIIEYLGGTT